MLFTIPLVLVILLFSRFAHCLRNVTVDETNSIIQYFPASSWSLHNGPTDSMDAGGGHMVTSDSSAYATLTFTFVSFYFMSTKWPYRVTTRLVVDGTDSIVADLQDHGSPDNGGGPATIASSVVATYIGTESRSHTIRLSVPSGDQYAVLDRFIFELEDDPTSSAGQSSIGGSIPSTVTSTATSTLTTNITPSKTKSDDSGPSSLAPVSSGSNSKTLTTALAITIPIVVVLALLVAYLLWRFCGCFRKTDRRDTEMYTEGNEYMATGTMANVNRTQSHAGFYRPMASAPVTQEYEPDYGHGSSTYTPLPQQREVGRPRDHPMYGDGSDSVGSRYSAASGSNSADMTSRSISTASRPLIPSISSLSSSEMAAYMAGGGGGRNLKRGDRKDVVVMSPPQEEEGPPTYAEAFPS